MDKENREMVLIDYRIGHGYGFDGYNDDGRDWKGWNRNGYNKIGFHKNDYDENGKVKKRLKSAYGFTYCQYLKKSFKKLKQEYGYDNCEDESTNHAALEKIWGEYKYTVSVYGHKFNWQCWRRGYTFEEVTTGVRNGEYINFSPCSLKDDKTYWLSIYTPIFVIVPAKK